MEMPRTLKAERLAKRGKEAKVELKPIKIVRKLQRESVGKHADTRLSQELCRKDRRNLVLCTCPEPDLARLFWRQGGVESGLPQRAVPMWSQQCVDNVQGFSVQLDLMGCSHASVSKVTCSFSLDGQH